MCETVRLFNLDSVLFAKATGAFVLSGSCAGFTLGMAGYAGDAADGFYRSVGANTLVDCLVELELSLAFCALKSGFIASVASEPALNALFAG